MSCWLLLTFIYVNIRILTLFNGIYVSLETISDRGIDLKIRKNFKMSIISKERMSSLARIFGVFHGVKFRIFRVKNRFKKKRLFWDSCSYYHQNDSLKIRSSTHAAWNGTFFLGCFFFSIWLFLIGAMVRATITKNHVMSERHGTHL